MAPEVWAPGPSDYETRDEICEIPRIPTIIAPSSPILEYGPWRQDFPLMELPLDLRRMVYREILTPSSRDQTLDAEKLNDSEVKCAQAEEKQLAIQDSEHRANFLTANRQINVEASSVWYETHYFKASVGSWVTIEGDREDVCCIMPTPMYLPKIRNLELHLSSLGYPRFNGRKFRHSMIWSTLKRFCQELVAKCHELRHVIVVVPCFCHKSEKERRSMFIGAFPQPLTEEHHCLTAEEFDQLTRPLRRLRVSGNVQLKSLCKKRGHYQPIFDQLAAVVKSADPVEDFSNNEKLYWKVRERAEEFLKKSARLRKDLHQLHILADVDMRMELDGASYRKPPKKSFFQNKFESQFQQVSEEIARLRT
ncbi:MAG: hypothetical protein Q9196_005033 [Gyalolechia fulgens]